MKLASSFSFFETKSCRAGPVWLEEAEIDLKFLKLNSLKQGLSFSLHVTFTINIRFKVLCSHNAHINSCVSSPIT
jgi:hypothetical protein